MAQGNCYFIDRKFFEENPQLTHVLDEQDPDKQSRRTYVFVRIELNGLPFYIPLRNNLGDAVRKYGRIGHAVPSSSRPRAGIDYRHAIIVPDRYAHPHQVKKLPNSQIAILTKEARAIASEFTAYVRKYVRAVNKGRLAREPLFADSSLVNYNDQLGISPRR